MNLLEGASPLAPSSQSDWTLSGRVQLNRVGVFLATPTTGRFISILLELELVLDPLEPQETNWERCL
jgi:hypothetical protein